MKTRRSVVRRGCIFAECRQQIVWRHLIDIDGNSLLDSVKLYGYYAVLRNEQNMCLRNLDRALRLVSERKRKVEKRLRWACGMSETCLTGSQRILNETLREMNACKMSSKSMGRDLA